MQQNFYPQNIEFYLVWMFRMNAGDKPYSNTSENLSIESLARMAPALVIIVLRLHRELLRYQIWCALTHSTCVWHLQVIKCASIAKLQLVASFILCGDNIPAAVPNSISADLFISSLCCTPLKSQNIISLDHPIFQI
jgi:hypothetical protein